MLKIKDSTGKVVGVLKDEDASPEMEEGEEPVKEEEEEEDDSTNDADV